MTKRILVIEDDRSLQRALTHALHRMKTDVQVDWMESAEEALYQIVATKARSKDCYDLIIADIFLPGRFTGLQLWQRCEMSGIGTPLLLMSGMSISEFFRSVGGNAIAPPFLQKPFHPEEFKHMAASLLGVKGEFRFTE